MAQPARFGMTMLQQTAGNCAAVEFARRHRETVVSHRSDHVPLSRFESPEHQDIGDRHLVDLEAYLQTDEGQAWASQHGYDAGEIATQIGEDSMRRGGKIRLASGVELSPGEVISLMGDFFESWEDLNNADPNEIRGSQAGGRPDPDPGLLDVMDDERHGRTTSGAATIAYERVTSGRYLRLAERNDAHFAPMNRTAWTGLHGEALTRARAAGEAGVGLNSPAMQEAYLLDASAGHFLTDAFASGHMFDKDQVLAAIHMSLASNPIQAANPEMQTYIGVIQQSGKMGQLVLKNIHDRLNREGFEMTNPRGMRWRTFGDDHLRSAEQTQRVAALAVFLSRQQIERAHRGESVDPNEVLELMPDDATVERATEVAISYVPQAASEVPNLVYRNRDVAVTQFGPIFGRIVQSNLSAIGHPGREGQVEQMLEANERVGGGPIVVPSFTILEWN